MVTPFYTPPPLLLPPLPHPASLNLSPTPFPASPTPFSTTPLRPCLPTLSYPPPSPPRLSRSLPHPFPHPASLTKTPFPTPSLPPLSPPRPCHPHHLPHPASPPLSHPVSPTPVTQVRVHCPPSVDRRSTTVSLGQLLLFLDLLFTLYLPQQLTRQSPFKLNFGYA